MKKIDTDCVKEAVIGHRRTIHRLAELGGKEYKTRDYVLEKVRHLGLPYEMVTETAVLVTLDTGRPGPHIALRADMEAPGLRLRAGEHLPCLRPRCPHRHALGQYGSVVQLPGQLERRGVFLL